MVDLIDVRIQLVQGFHDISTLLKSLENLLYVMDRSVRCVLSIDFWILHRYDFPALLWRFSLGSWFAIKEI